MAISLTGVVVGTGTITIPASAAAGNLGLIVAYTFDPYTPAGWNAVPLVDSGTQYAVLLWKELVAGEPGSTFDGPGGLLQMVTLAGAKTSAAPGIAPSTASSTTTFTTARPSSPGVAVWIQTFLSFTSDPTVTHPTEVTEDHDSVVSGSRQWIGHEQQASAGTLPVRAYTLSSAAVALGAVVAVEPSGTARTGTGEASVAFTPAGSGLVVGRGDASVAFAPAGTGTPGFRGTGTASLLYIPDAAVRISVTGGGSVPVAVDGRAAGLALPADFSGPAYPVPTLQPPTTTEKSVIRRSETYPPLEVVDGLPQPGWGPDE